MNDIPKRNPDSQKTSIIEYIDSVFRNLQENRKLSKNQIIIKWTTAIAVLVLFVGVFVIDVLVSIKMFESSWYYFYFLSNENISTSGMIIVALESIRWFISIAFLIGFAFGVFLNVLPENDSVNRLSLNVLRWVFISFFVLIFVIGLNNLVLYSAIGWNYLSPQKIFEGLIVLFGFLLATMIILGIRFRSSTKTVSVLETLFNIGSILYPIMFIILSSTNQYTIYPSGFIIPVILLSLFVFLAGIDEIRGNPSLYMRAIGGYLDLEKSINLASHVDNKRTIVMAQAMASLGQLTPNEQSQITQWVHENTKPTFARRFWSTVKIILSTAALAFLVEEPVSLFFKWLLKVLFNIST
ncbi:MAG: hypothetical protein IH589_06705 [Anaerolineales bacterium]|nr:hypothetical protein [Anaerolineales bacterium]